MPATIKNNMILYRFKELAKGYYTEPTDEEILILSWHSFHMILQYKHKNLHHFKEKIKKMVKSRNKHTIHYKNIFSPSRKWPTKRTKGQQQSYCNWLAFVLYKKNSKRYTLLFLFNSSSSDSFCQLSDYYLKGINLREFKGVYLLY